MKATAQTHADMLNSLLAEDREEIRQIRTTLGHTVLFLTTASFGITAFLLGPNPPVLPESFGLLTDATLVIFIWTIFCQLFLNLRGCRQALKARQDLLNGLDESRPVEVNLFPDTSAVVPDIKDTDQFWLPSLATAAIFIKVLILLQV